MIRFAQSYLFVFERSLRGIVLAYIGATPMQPNESSHTHVSRPDAQPNPGPRRPAHPSGVSACSVGSGGTRAGGNVQTDSEAGGDPPHLDEVRNGLIWLSHCAPKNLQKTESNQKVQSQIGESEWGGSGPKI